MSEKLTLLFKDLRLPGFRSSYQEVAEVAEDQGWSFVDYLTHLAELELEGRQHRRIQRNLRRSKLPREKTLSTLQQERLDSKVRRKIPTLCEGGFADRAENILLFGLPGRGKTHLACAIGHELIQRDYRVLFMPTFRLVQQLLQAKQDLELEELLHKLDRFEVIILDDIGYVQQERAEMEVLFTLLAERYERKSMIITSNLVFSKWDQIFKDAMTTAAAIDRVVHHSTIIEMTGSSYRTDAAQQRQTDTDEKSDHEE